MEECCSRTLTSDYLYGKLYGSIHAVDGTKILDNGYNGTDATFTGNVNGNLSGNITLSGQQESINDIGNGLKINNNKLESAGWILTQLEGLLAENRPGKQLYTDSNNVDSVSISSHIEVGKEQASTSNRICCHWSRSWRKCKLGDLEGKDRNLVMVIILV